MLNDEIKNKINLNNDFDLSLKNFIANGKVDKDDFSLKKFISEIDNIENDQEMQVMDIQKESKKSQNQNSNRRFGTKVKFSERFKDDDDDDNEDEE